MGGTAVVVLLCFGTTVFAHDPDAPDIEASEVSIEAERPVAASSQQFIPTKNM